MEDVRVERHERYALAAEAAGLAFWEFEAPSGEPRFDISKIVAADFGASPTSQGEVHPDDRARVEGELNLAVAGARHFECEYRVVQPDGRLRHMRSAARLKRDSKGRSWLYGVSFDVTAQKETQIGLERARDAAEAANRAKSEFLATMSHEVRTPLNGVIGMNALLLESDLTDRQRRMAAAIRESAEALLSITDDILDFSKLEAGRMEIDESDFDLRRLIHAAVELFTPRAREKRIVLLADAARVSRAALRGDALRLRQILLNLLSNAVKFTANGSVTIAVSTHDEAPDRTRVRVEVLDDGPGVDRQTQQRLFKPFEQADHSTSRQFGGTGLGLSISKRLVDLMGGRIGMDERPQGGSAFWFEVVVRPAPAGAPSPAPPTPAVAAQRGKSSFSGRILLAEDNRVNVEVTTMILEAAGYGVDLAVDGNEAVDAVARRRYDLVLMDMQMPLLDGLAATRAIRASEGAGARLPIVAMTASATKEDRRRCLESGMDDYVSKPFMPAALIENVSRWIERSQSAPAREAGFPAASVSQWPVVDESAVEAFRAIAPEPKFVALLSGYVENLDRLSHVLTRLKAAPATVEIGREAHKLIMGSGTFGARQVQELALLLQAACNRNETSSVVALTDSLLSASAAASTALRIKYRLSAL